MKIYRVFTAKDYVKKIYYYYYIKIRILAAALAQDTRTIQFASRFSVALLGRHGPRLLQVPSEEEAFNYFLELQNFKSKPYNIDNC